MLRGSGHLGLNLLHSRTRTLHRGPGVLKALRKLRLIALLDFRSRETNAGIELRSLDAVEGAEILGLLLNSRCAAGTKEHPDKTAGGSSR